MYRSTLVPEMFISLEVLIYIFHFIKIKKGVE
jgi:hypothetical protein